MIHRRSIALMLGGSAVLGLLCASYVEGLRINATASMPIGLWQVTRVAPDQIRDGSIVAVCIPRSPTIEAAVQRRYIRQGSCANGLEPLVKPVAAIHGDVVTVGSSGIWINGTAVANTAQLTHDTANRALQSTPQGTYTVQDGQVWLLATRVRNSFDSRYFGPVPASGIQAIARPLWVVR